MKLLLKAQIEQMRHNAKHVRDAKKEQPVVKLFTPDGAATWLLSEMDDDNDTCFGLCDLGFGTPELGYVSLAELQEIRGHFGLPVERDRHFTPKKTLAEYANDAFAVRRITV